MPSAAKKRVAVVGGGVAGSLVTKLLQNTADVTLIDPKDYFEVPYAALRCLVEPKLADRSVISHSSYMKKSKLHMSEATKATRTEVTTESGQKIPFDFLVICTGSAYVGPRTRQERIAEYQTDYLSISPSRKCANEFRAEYIRFSLTQRTENWLKRKKLLVIGGGPVGVELAGEIVTDFPNKKVTIVTSSDRLLGFLGPNVSDKAHKWLEMKKVEVIFNDMVDPSAKVGNTYTTRAGKKIEAELHFWCVGKRLGNTWLQNSEYKEWCDETGRLKVDPSLRLVGVPNVFCAGDITDIPEIKQGYLAKKHAGVVVENIKKLIRHPTSKKLSSYCGLEKPFGIVTLGRHVAVAQFMCCSCVGCFPALFKNKDLFVGDSRKELGLSG